jgi:release factor family 3
MTPTIAGTLKNLNIDELKALARQSGPCITIQVPAYQPGAGGGSRQANLRQLTHTAVEELGKLDRPGEAALAAAALENLIATLPIERGGPGMTLFCAPGFEAAYETPGVREEVTVGDYFYLVPQLTNALAPQDFFILGISQKHLRLFHYQYGRCAELPLPAAVPASLEVAGSFDKPDHTLEGRSAGGPSLGAMRGVRFSVSGEHDSEAEYMRHFFEAVDKGLKETLQGASLFLAGVHEEIGLYRKVAKYAHIFEAECHGNAEHSSLDQITKHAAAGALREYRGTSERALHNLNEARNKVIEPNQVLEAATSGRVRQLFVAEDPQPTQRDVLNAAVVEAIRTGSEVFSFAGADVKGFGPLAALFRY